jgi:single-strand binding domain protein
MENYSDNNSILIGGVVVSEPEFSHEVFEEKFYSFNLETKRLSDYNDVLPVIISERLIDIKSIKNGLLVKIKGQFRSYNKLVDNKSKLVLSIFAKEIEVVEDESVITLNEANFIGYICKNPIYRKTPLGREIADVLVAVNRSYKKSDYIPCILWGRNAKFCETLSVGSRVKLTGRIQSRKYEKKLEDGTVLSKVAYEVSISKFAIDKDEEKEVEQSVVE